MLVSLEIKFIRQNPKKCRTGEACKATSMSNISYIPDYDTEKGVRVTNT